MKTSLVHRHRSSFAGAVLAAAVLLCAGAGAAQTDPTKPIRLIVPGSTGGGIDTLARIMAQASSTPGQQAVVENRGGANGMIGTELAACIETGIGKWARVVEAARITPE